MNPLPFLTASDHNKYEISFCQIQKFGKGTVIKILPIRTKCQHLSHKVIMQYAFRYLLDTLLVLVYPLPYSLLLYCIHCLHSYIAYIYSVSTTILPILGYLQY